MEWLLFYLIFGHSRKKVAAAFLPPLYQLILRLCMGTYFSNHLFKVVFSCHDHRMVVYGYKPDIFLAVYPILQGKEITNA